MQRSKKDLATAAMVGLMVVAVCLLFTYIDYVIWRTIHPDAPMWTFFFSGKH